MTRLIFRVIGRSVPSSGALHVTVVLSFLHVLFSSLSHQFESRRWLWDDITSEDIEIIFAVGLQVLFFPNTDGPFHPHVPLLPIQIRSSLVNVRNVILTDQQRYEKRRREYGQPTLSYEAIIMTHYDDIDII
mmetsp:Transcript_55183/g.134098  ORF Transcript_55183/g.134098 Transcript_55183/m.134098 type:complete len:132 (-) Transcript_55183:696-1091(-)